MAIAQKKKTPTVKPKPKNDRLATLPAPEFSPTLPRVLYSGKNGQLKLQWLPVKNALRYDAYITDNKGHLVKLLGVVHTNITVHNLPPPSKTQIKRVYWVQMATQNKDQVIGKYGPKRKIIYLGKALATPKIESIHVEE